MLLLNIVAALLVGAATYQAYLSATRYGKIFPCMAALVIVLMTCASGLIIWLVLKLNGII